MIKRINLTHRRDHSDTWISLTIFYSPRTSIVAAFLFSSKVYSSKLGAISNLHSLTTRLYIDHRVPNCFTGQYYIVQLKVYEKMRWSILLHCPSRKKRLLMKSIWQRVHWRSSIREIVKMWDYSITRNLLLIEIQHVRSCTIIWHIRTEDIGVIEAF